MTNPCKDCEKRHEACWGHCEDYKAWKKQYTDVAEKRQKENASATIRVQIPKRWRKKGF